MVVVWPDHRYEVLTNVSANTRLTLDQKNASGSYDFSPSETPLFESTDEIDVAYRHQENLFIEFNREVLVPHMSSTEGPRLAVGDVNGDGLEDFFVGGAKHQPGAIFLQQPNGFEASRQLALQADSLSEDVGAILTDVDQDNDPDLIVVSGGNEFRGEQEALLVRLYKNDGQGHFTRDRVALPNTFVNGSCVAAGDFDQDGDADLFVGGRVVSRSYGKLPRSYLLQNDGQGNFTDVTEQLTEGLTQVGMVKDAHWADLDDDGWLELIVAGEWMPVSVFTNQQGRLARAAIPALDNASGWWNTLEVADIDGDGDPDLLAGNLGLNSKLKASPDEPVSLVVKDVDQNGTTEQLLFHYVQGQKQLFATKDELSSQLVDIKNRFVSYDAFARASMEDVFPADQLADAEELRVNEARSGAFVNDGEMNFRFVPFPAEAQFSPVNAIQVLEREGLPNLLTAGNFYEVTIERGRYDADYGTLLSNRGNGRFAAVPNPQSGVYLEGQVRDLETINFRGEDFIIVARNNETLSFIKKHHDASITASADNP